jgi:RNA polymerase primary sigma factor
MTHTAQSPISFLPPPPHPSHALSATPDDARFAAAPPRRSVRGDRPRSADPVAQFFSDVSRHRLLTPQGERACAMRVAAGRLAVHQTLACLPAAYDLVARWRGELADGAQPWTFRIAGEADLEAREEDEVDEATVERLRAEALAGFDAILRHSNQVPYNGGPGSLPGAAEALAAFGFLPARHDRLTATVADLSRELAAIDMEAARAARTAGRDLAVFAAEWRRFEPAGEAGFGEPGLVASERALASFGGRIRLPVAVFRRLAGLLQRAEAEIRSAKSDLAHANFRLVAKIAATWRRSGVPLADLIQEGNIGLMRAVELYDYARGFKFSTYASWWIRQGVARAVAEQSRTIRIPVHVTEDMGKVARTASAIRRRTGSAPTDTDIAAASGLAVDLVRKCLQAVTTTSLDAEIGGEDGKGETLAALVRDERAVSPDDAAHRVSVGRLLTRAMGLLTAREERVLRLRFGIGVGVEEATCETIGDALGVSRERIRQVEAQALRKLRHPARSRALRAAA